MTKKFTVEGEIVEKTELFKVIKSSTNGKFYIFHLTKDNEDAKDTYYIAEKYKVIGAAVLYEDMSSKYYSNLINWQPYGQGRSLCHTMGIDSWKTKVVDGKEQTIVKYFDEKGYKYIRYVDEQGNLYKKKKQEKQLQEVEIVSL